MLTNTLTIRHYQKLTDALVEMWNRGYRYEEMRIYLDGYLASLRISKAIEPFLINKLAVLVHFQIQLAVKSWECFPLI